jgi:hypothetical protein
MSRFFAFATLVRIALGTVWSIAFGLDMFRALKIIVIFWIECAHGVKLAFEFHSCHQDGWFSATGV